MKEYHSLSPGDQAAFLKENLELYANPRDEWLRTHSKENALLALFGKADIFSIAAYNEVHALAKELDIPKNAMVLKELDRITQLNLSYYEQNNLLDVYGGLDNNIEDENGETARSRAIDLLKKDNPNWVDDMRRIEALRVGTDEVPTPTEFVDAWADRGHVIDEFGSGSIEAKLWLLDNKNVHQWALDNELLTDDGSKWNEPILRLQAQWAPDFDKYDSYGDVKSDAYIGDDEGRAKARRGLLYIVEPSWQPGQLSEFGRAYYTKAASSAGYSEENWMRYTEFVVLPEWGSWRDRFLLESRSRDFYAEYITEGEGHSLVNESKIKPLIRDKTYGKFFDEFNQWDETGGMTEEEVKALHAKLDQVTRGQVSFREARYRVDAYDKYIEPAVIEDYVEWYTSPEIDRPEGYEGDWYEDDWWLQDHEEFVLEMEQKYQETDGSVGWKPNDDRFRTTPTKEVFALWEIYNNLPKGSARLNFRIENKDLDEWGQLTQGWKPATGTVTKEEKEQLTLDEQIAGKLADLGRGDQELDLFQPTGTIKEPSPKWIAESAFINPKFEKTMGFEKIKSYGETSLIEFKSLESDLLDEGYVFVSREVLPGYDGSWAVNLLSPSKVPHVLVYNPDSKQAWLFSREGEIEAENVIPGWKWPPTEYKA